MREKILGVIEGFYGSPWSHKNRLACIDFIADSGWNTYVWAAKQEPRHRDQWSEPFTNDELNQFEELSNRSPAVQLAVGLTPGANASEQQVINKLLPAIHAGGEIVVLCFDDLPVLDAAQQHRNLAHAVRNEIGVPVWIVPTHYAGMSSSPYLTELCNGLDPAIEVMWTGPSVVADRITSEEALQRTEVTGGRLPLVWDNTPVNDVRMRPHLHMGPFTGRDQSLLIHCSGFLWNPMEEFAASLPTLTSAAAWSRNEDPMTAWSSYVDKHNLRLLAEATAYRSDAHWPGDSPSRSWWEALHALEVDDPEVEPWANAAKAGAQIALAALSVIEAKHELSPKETNMILFQLMDWSAFRSSEKLTLGAGPRTRPIATQDGNGRFVLLPDSIQQSLSLVDQLVSRALEKLHH